MPLRPPPVDLPPVLTPLLQEAQFAFDSNGKRVCRIDVDVDAGTLLAIHEFEAHLRRRPVQLKLPASAECMTGEMASTFSLGAPSDRSRCIAKVRLSFYNLQDGECVDGAESD
ncbi:hypothetical protein JKG68_06990 [Microvirga aerilata]|jgi:hypothetical protein|uniref:Uncharacterized protein n=1 Tax=Microvirga aerilata TaxID=670292 RepID=A0A936ZFC2_9HYPH|nr:hypothetical protein [Microvirga aerilata]MBL0403704.1 hypothetical protein [Microvirga aerilata]